MMHGKRVQAIARKNATERKEHAASNLNERGESADFPLDEPVPLSQILPLLYTKKQWKQGWSLVQLSRNWPQIVGEHVALLTRPAYLRHDVLWIYVQNSAWMHHVQMIKLDLLARIHQAQKKLILSDIRCLVDPVQAEMPVPPRQGEKAKQETLHSPLSEQSEKLQQVIMGIEEKDCRCALEKLWRRWLDRKSRPR